MCERDNNVCDDVTRVRIALCLARCALTVTLRCVQVVKLLARLVQEEPRLARKILVPLKDLILKTKAKSVQYEALYAAACTIPYVRCAL